LCELVRGVTYSKDDEVESDGFKILRANNIKLDNNSIDFSDVKQVSKDLNLSDKQKLKAKDIFICTASGSADHIGKTAFVDSDLDYYFGGFMGAIRCNESILPEYLFQNLQGERFNSYLNNIIAGANIKNLKAEFLYSFKIPLPPLSVQHEIVSKIKQHEKIIFGAKQVVENYKPQIEINPEWEILELGSVCDIKHGFAFKSEDFATDGNTDLPIVLAPGNYNEDGSLSFSEKNTRRYAGKVDNEYLFKKGDLTVVMTDLSPKMKILGNPAIIQDENILHNQRIGKLLYKNDSILPKFLYYVLLLPTVKEKIKQTATGALIKHTSPSRILELKIPKPSKDVQLNVVSQLENEESLVNANKELIAIYELKIKNEIDKLWAE
jgi:restriction endonuclease S subunit